MLPPIFTDDRQRRGSKPVNDRLGWAGRSSQAEKDDRLMWAGRSSQAEQDDRVVAGRSSQVGRTIISGGAGRSWHLGARTLRVGPSEVRCARTL